MVRSTTTRPRRSGRVGGNEGLGLLGGSARGTGMDRPDVTWYNSDPMEIRRAMPVIKTNQPRETRAFYEDFLGFRVAMDEDGMLMLASTTTPTTQVIVAWRARPQSTPN